MKRGEVWWDEFDPSIGSETRKTRPAAIVSNDAANRNLSRAVVTVGSQRSKAMADQIMAADKSRLKEQLGVLSKSDVEAVEAAIKVHLGLPL